MAEFNQFGSVQPSGQRSKAQCAQCEAMLTDALDHLLSPEDQKAFDLHLATCADCTRMYMDARRGADWLVMLKEAQPEPPADLLSRILASTGPAKNAAPVIAEAVKPNTLLGDPQLAAEIAPAQTGKVLPFRQRVVSAFRVQTLRYNFMQPRLAMTAAMAFFSIALTLNLTGIHITQLRASDFTPSSIKRSFYDTNAKVVRSIDNLRVVYELESRVRDLQQNNEPAGSDNNQNNNEQKQDDKSAPNEQKQPAPRPRSGSSRTNLPAGTLQYTAAATQKQYTAHNGSPQPVARLLQVSFRTPNVFSTPNQLNKNHSGGQA